MTYAEKARDPKPYSKTLFRRELSEAFDIMRETCSPKKGKDANILIDIVENTSDPCSHLYYIGKGCFKATYELPHLNNYVVKFCSQKNPTQDEKAILEVAKIENMNFAFCPTGFVDFYGMTCDLDELIDDAYDNDDEAQIYDEEAGEWIDNEDWCGRYATALEIQPRVEKAGDTYWIYWRDYENEHGDPLTNPDTGEIVDYDTIKTLNIASREWLERFLHLYGNTCLERLADFVCKYHIFDLHNDNIGYWYCDGVKLPVILDWLSPSADWIKKTSLH